MKMPQITGHSGCEGTPRDSMASIERAAALGADAVEVDVRRGSDGILRISHDRLKEPDLQEKPTLEAVFQRVASTDLRINCDIKEPFAIPGTLELAGKFGFDRSRLILSGAVSPESLMLEPTLAEKASIYLNIEEVLEYLAAGKLTESGRGGQFPELLAAPQAMLPRLLTDDVLTPLLGMIASLPIWGLNLPHGILTEESARRFRQAGVRLSVWTVNEPEDLARCLALDVDNITTLAVQTALSCRSRTA